MAPRTVWRGAVAALTLVLLAGCATVPASADKATKDPWESFNRKVFAFNDKIDKAVLKPVAETYRDAVPRLVRQGVTNVLGNIGDVWSTANNFLQGKVQVGFEMGMRVATNTVFGLFGLLDPATEMGLTKRPEDFGQTLGRWGLASGPFVVLPLVGPSTVRDTAGFLVDRQASPSSLPDAEAGRYGVLALELVSTRATFLSTGELVNEVALDRYTFVRDAYLARRRDVLYDGAPPMDTFNYDDYPAPLAPAPPAAAAKPASAASAPR